MWVCQALNGYLLLVWSRYLLVDTSTTTSVSKITYLSIAGFAIVLLSLGPLVQLVVQLALILGPQRLLYICV